MKLSYQKILFEIMYLSVVCGLGCFSGYLCGRYGLYYMNKAVVYISYAILDIPGGVEFVK